VRTRSNCSPNGVGYLQSGEEFVRRIAKWLDSRRLGSICGWWINRRRGGAMSALWRKGNYQVFKDQVAKLACSNGPVIILQIIYLCTVFDRLCPITPSCWWLVGQLAILPKKPIGFPVVPLRSALFATYPLQRQVLQAMAARLTDSANGRLRRAWWGYKPRAPCRSRRRMSWAVRQIQRLVVGSPATRPQDDRWSATSPCDDSTLAKPPSPYRPRTSDRRPIRAFRGSAPRYYGTGRWMTSNQNPYESPHEPAGLTHRRYSGARIVLWVLLFFFGVPLVHAVFVCLTTGFQSLRPPQVATLAMYTGLTLAIALALYLIPGSRRQ